MSKESFTLTINDQALTFAITLENYNYFVNGISQNNKVSMAHNFCMQTIVDEHKEALKAVLKRPGASLQITNVLMQHYAPELDITVKPVPTSAKQ